ncbi:hypothetical protein DV965_14270, partial [Staphylococcus pseudintermedius]|uniref:Rib/alpha-like domain-containing protein n=1 Tax=Staphylococcus pseudintermedius TaxID=283734 RepID=UPI000E38D43D
ETQNKITEGYTETGKHDTGKEEGNKKPKVPVEVPQTKCPNVQTETKLQIQPKGIPEARTAEVEQENGEMTETPAADATRGQSVVIARKVTYPDGSSEET